MQALSHANMCSVEKNRGANMEHALNLCDVTTEVLVKGHIGKTNTWSENISRSVLSNAQVCSIETWVSMFNNTVPTVFLQ